MTDNMSEVIALDMHMQPFSSFMEMLSESPSTQMSSEPPASPQPTINYSTTSRRRHPKKRIKTSFIWKHAVPPNDGSFDRYDKDGDIEWQCAHCCQTYKYGSGTGKAISHLKKEHSLYEDADFQRRVNENRLSIRNAMKRAAERQTERRLSAVDTTATQTLDTDTLEQLYVRWIVTNSIPFNQVSWKEFRAFLEYVNPEANKLLPTSPSTISGWVQRTFTQEKERIKHNLQTALSSIHFTVDLWTSPNSLSLFAVIAHWTSEDGAYMQGALAMVEIEEEHRGENLAQALYEILANYQILTKLGYFMMDNAINNDTMLEILQVQLEAEGISFNTKTQRLRCNGHIINLAAQAFLFGVHPDALDLEGESISSSTEEDLAKWRRLGPLGQLHNIVTHIRRTPQRLQAFRKLSDGLSLRKDNSTRWNAWFDIIDWALQQDIKGAIEAFCAQTRELAADRLSYDDWDTLQHIRNFLRPFKHATESTEGSSATIEQILPTMDFLLERLETASELYKDHLYMAPCIKTGWAKLNKYYVKTERVPAYAAAIVLNLSWKWTYFEKLWLPDWVEKARTDVEKFWAANYKAVGISLPQPNTDTSTYCEPNEFERWIRQKQAPITIQDEYQKYLSQPCIPEIADARAWWMESSQRKAFPCLSLMALDLLSIPAMSAEPERLFSSAKHTVTDNRNRLQQGSINATECLKSWAKIDTI